jgi:hypothetical protein
MRPINFLLPLVILGGCGLPVGPVTGPAAADPELAPIPQVMMGALQEDLGIGEVQAAAILGNLAQETGNFTMLQQVGGPSFGYSQWLGSRKRAFFAFAEENGGRHSFEANYGFLLHEIETEYPAMVARLRVTDDLDAASRIFMREFLRPSPKHANLPARVRYAEAYLSADFDGAGCVGEDHVIGDRILPCPEQLTPEPSSSETLLAQAETEVVTQEEPAPEVAVITAVEAGSETLALVPSDTKPTLLAAGDTPDPQTESPDVSEADTAPPEVGLLRLAARLFRPLPLRDM